jgi:hypothetical protein
VKFTTETDSKNSDSEQITVSFVVWIGIVLAMIVFLIITGLVVWFFKSRSGHREIESPEDGPGFEIDDDRFGDPVSDSFSWAGNSANIGPFWDDPIGRICDFELEEGQF